MTLNPLITAFRQHDAVLFVGAGLSIGAGLPSWVALIQPLVQIVGAPWPTNPGDIRASHLLATAQYYENQFGRRALIQHLRRELTTSGKNPTQVHELLLKLPNRIIFTTNYDDFLERICRQAGHSFNAIVETPELALWSAQETQIIKLCGDLNRPASIVITEHDFNIFPVTRAQLVMRLRATLEIKTPLFLGYSLQDPFLNQVWDQIGLDFGTMQRVGYTVLFDATPFEVEALRRRHIEVINLCPMGSSPSQLLESWLNDLIAQI